MLAFLCICAALGLLVVAVHWRQALWSWWASRKRPHLIAAIRLRCDHWGIAEWQVGRDTTRTRCPTCNVYGEVSRPWRGSR